MNRLKRTYWTNPFVLRLEAASNFALQTLCYSPDNQGPPPESGAHGPRVSFVVVETDVFFFILKGRSAMRRVLRKCFDCQKRKAKPAKQFMAELPKHHATPSEPPFTYVGIDCFGPIEVKQGRSLLKRYGCLFTCLTVRAVHIEILHSVSADSMINALRRFISMRGCPKEIRSDNGTNFTRA